MSCEFDFVVIGAGIAGASVAAHLAETHKVLILEMEDRPGYHTTGRSAAAYEPNYGPAPIRALTRASREFFSKGGYLTPRETIFLMPPEQSQAFEKLIAEQQGMREATLSEVKSKFPLLRDGYATRAILDPGTADIDVDLLHQDFIRLFKSRGGKLVCAEPVTATEKGAGWLVTTSRGQYRAQIIINAAGAWGDHVAKLSGVAAIGLQPKRRSMAVIAGPVGSMAWPMTSDVGETWYCKPQSGKLLVSPADATPVDPHDAYSDDMALAEGIDRFHQAVDIEVTHVEHSWGGLRSFSPDGNPVIGFDPIHAGFFWLIGQGGYGIQTAPAISRLAAALAGGKAAPAEVEAEGLVLSDISPSRF